MKQIWKFPLHPDVIAYDMPAGAKILTVQVQDDTPVLWALVNPLAPKEPRQIRFIPTGQDMEGDNNGGLEYINTFQIPTARGILVFHAFEILKPAILTNTKN